MQRDSAMVKTSKFQSQYAADKKCLNERETLTTAHWFRKKLVLEDSKYLVKTGSVINVRERQDLSRCGREK